MNKKSPRKQIIYAYRHLYRSALQAVCYSQPASTVVRQQLRSAFRAPDAVYKEKTITRTIWFLKNAAQSTGVEHKIVRNILMVRWWRDHTAKQDRPSWRALVTGTQTKRSSLAADTAYVHYEKTIEMLNKSLDICLPVR